MAEPLRLATYNIRNVRALDWASCWLRRRGRLARAIAALDADIVAMQEAYPSQQRYLGARALPGHAMVGVGRNRDGGGEACPLFVRRDRWRIMHAETRWFGDSPHEPGSRLPDAGFPRIATIAVVERADGWRVVVANTHLDEKSDDRRAASASQLVDWLAEFDEPHIVCGDLNALPDESPLAVLRDAGFASALDPSAGPTSNGFGDDEHAKLIDYVLIRGPVEVVSAEVDRSMGMVSDHWPVVVELAP